LLVSANLKNIETKNREDAENWFAVHPLGPNSKFNLTRQKRWHGEKMQRSTWATLKSKIGKWRLLFVVFLVVYLLFLLFNLGSMTIQWDEASHLDGGLLLLHGQVHSYMATGLFYPPLDDLILAGYFAVAGPSVFVGRLIAVTFAALSIVAVFEFANRIYGPRTAFVSSVLLATMPGFVWLSRVTMLETTLIFFFSVSMMTFFLWLQKHEDKFLILSGAALGLGFLAKYQVIVAVIAMLASIFLIGKGYLKKRLSRFPFLIITAVIIVVPWIIVAYQAYSTGMLNQWLYAMNIGNPQKSAYSLRFPAPVFYLIEMVWPYGITHPVSIFIYCFSLVGLGFFTWRRKPEDKFLLIWFLATYVFFTLVGNKQWRYMVPVLPVFAMSAASLIMFAYGKAEKTWKLTQTSLKRVRLGKIAATILIVITVFAVAYSSVDAYNWVQKDNAFKLPLDQASKYVASRLSSNESLVVLCPINVFSADIAKFYVHAANQGTQVDMWQYPESPVDTYRPVFNLTELINLCDLKNAKYLLLFEYGETYLYFDSNLTMSAVYSLLMTSQRFSVQTSFGNYPTAIFVLSFA
jgi:4-amino-4-deoxy-L-arabinose transferase-like glycosyltransferase